MSMHRGRGIDQDTAERLLGGDSGGPRIGPDRLVELFAALTAPGHPGEMAGEQAALNAFRQARLDPVTLPRRGSMIKPVLAKLLTAKIALVAATTAALSGGAVAAAKTGNLPDLPGGRAHPSTPTVSPGPPEKPAQAGTVGARDDASPSLSMVGLCHAYTAGVADSHGKALDNPAFSVLIQNAGGRDEVAGYCASVLAGKPDSHPTGRAGEHGSPTSHPTEPGRPDSHPTGGPGEHGSPTSHPDPRPTAKPTHANP